MWMCKGKTILKSSRIQFKPLSMFDQKTQYFVDLIRECLVGILFFSMCTVAHGVIQVPQRIKIRTTADIGQRLIQHFPICFPIRPPIKEVSVIWILSPNHMYGSDHIIKRISFQERVNYFREMRLKYDFHTDSQINLIIIFLQKR